MKPSDHIYIGVPWKDGGRTFQGADCVGLAVLWLGEHYGFKAPVPDRKQQGRATELLAQRDFDAIALARGDVVFFAKAGVVRHVGIWLGEGKLLHTVNGYCSRVDNGFKFLARSQYYPVAAIKPEEAEVLSAVLADATVKWTVVIGIVISVILSVVSSLLMPKLPRSGNKYGKYGGFDSLVTQVSTEIPLPDLLGAVVGAGNSPYTQLSDKNLSATATDQRANKIIVFASGPVEGLDMDDVSFTINGLTYTDKYFRDATAATGFKLNPSQTKAEAHTGTINGETMVPSVSFYPGEQGTSVPVDVRADYDRTFPIYGFSGCCYAVFRLIDSTKFPQFNVTIRIKGRQCRTFGTSQFITQNNTEILTGDGVTTRFKLGTEDIAGMNSLDVDATSYVELDGTHQSGDVYTLNRTKGFVEFLTAPANATSIYLDYDAYVREWTQNPAAHILYLLTEIGRGNGFDASKINFQSFSDAADYYDATASWIGASGVTSGPRYTTNYAVDFRKPIQEHLRALLDACRSVLFVSDGKFCLKPIQAETSVFSFDASNIVRDSFAAELADRADRPNRIKAFYHTSETYQAETEAVREDVADQAAREARGGNGGVVEENLKFPAVDNQSQAERLAEIHLRTQVNARLRVSWKTTVQGLALEVGDVVDITHPSQPTWAGKLFRVEDFKLDEDGRIELQGSEYFAGAEI